MMWKEYSKSYLKANRAAGLSLMAAVLIASAFLSLISGIFYNMWADSVQRIRKEDGDWHARVTGNFSEEDLQLMKSFSNVQKIQPFKPEPGKNIWHQVEIVLDNPRRVYEDIPLLAEKLSIDPEYPGAVEYHFELLLSYLIYSPKEREAPPLLLPLYLFIMLISMAAMLLVIYAAFEVTGNARLHQLGILQSVGATPGQIRMVLLQEAAVLSFPAILTGILIGNGLTMAFLHVANGLGDRIQNIGQREDAIFRYSPLVFWVSFGACVLTVCFSAFFSARRLGKKEVLELLRGGEEVRADRVKGFRLFSSLFGVEGELARKSLYVRRKSFRPAVLSLTFSFLAISIFLNMMALSDISTQETYFERYGDVWDLMLTVEPDSGEKEGLLTKLREIPEVSECTAYQIGNFSGVVAEGLLSDEIRMAGGLAGLSGVEQADKGYLVPVDLILLDEESFRQYVEECGLSVGQEEAVLVNQIWDSRNSHFRQREYLPYVKEQEELGFTVFVNEDLEDGGKVSKPVEIQVGGYTMKEPALREEYRDFCLFLVMNKEACPVRADAEMFYQMLVEPKAQSGKVYRDIQEMLGTGYTLEDRQATEVYNKEVLSALKLLYSGICVLLAMIGFANIFANMLGQTILRKKEFARYQSVGMTPAGVWRTLLLEGMALAGGPILVSIPVNVVLVVLMANSARISLGKYMANCPIVPLGVFVGMYFTVTGVACALGGRKIFSGEIVDGVREEIV